MSLCGCFPACSCVMRACDNGLLTITGDGDPLTDGWELCVNETVFAAVNDDGGVAITAEGAYGHAPRLNLVVEDSDTIALSVTPGVGLQAFLIDAPGGSGGVPTGTPLMWLTDVAPAGYLMASGVNAVGYVDIADYPALFAVVGHSMSGGVDPADGTFYVGVPADSFFKTSGPANSTMAGTGGSLTASIGVANLPPHAHGVSDPGHGHAGSTISINNTGNHTHEGAGANHDFLVENTSPSAYVYVHVDAVNVDTVDTMRFTSNGLEGGDSYKPNREGFTFPDGSHNHTGSVAVAGAFTGITILNEGSGTPLPLPLPPYWTGNIIIKT